MRRLFKMNDDIAVKIENVGKYFRLPTESTNSLRTLLVNRMKGIKGYTEQHVLKDISFEVKKGDFFGVVGRNGSGKSTLLKIISQIYAPEKGKVTVNGKLVSFIELGVGFNPELTGKENVYMNGAMLGFSTSEIDEMYEEIVEFAELQDFMNQKLKNYSSGMQVRLAFSVAIKARGDVLVLDEVLAVGDEAFQRKCNEFFEEIKKDRSKTVILVTHDMSAVQRYCNKGIYIKNGILEGTNEIEDIATRYSEDNLEVNVGKTAEEAKVSTASIKINPLSKLVLNRPEQEFKFEIQYEVFSEKIKSEKNLYLAYALFDEGRGGIVYDSGSINTNGTNKLSFSIPMKNFHNSNFRISATLRRDPKNKDEKNFETEPVVYTKGESDLRFIYRDINDKENYALLKELE